MIGEVFSIVILVDFVILYYIKICLSFVFFSFFAVLSALLYRMSVCCSDFNSWFCR